MQRAAFLYLSLLAGIFTYLLFAGAGGADSLVVMPNEEKASGTANYQLETPQRVRPPRLKDSYTFAGEAVPVDDGDVRERLDRELITNTFYHSSTQFILKAKSRYFPTIERILAEEGVPDDLKYIAIAESALKDFRSPAGAAGVWHFMPGTAKDYGLEVNGVVDERYHLEKSTRAAARFLKDLREQLGSWTLAAAAYNRGAAGVRRDKEEQRGSSYYDLNMNEETGRYVFRIIALKDILEDPTYYGFFLDEQDYYPPVEAYSTVEVSESIANLGDFANRYGTTYRKIKVYNPWLRDSHLSVSGGKRYEIRIPR